MGKNNSARKMWSKIRHKRRERDIQKGKTRVKIEEDYEKKIEVKTKKKI